MFFTYPSPGLGADISSRRREPAWPPRKLSTTQKPWLEMCSSRIMASLTTYSLTMACLCSWDFPRGKALHARMSSIFRTSWPPRPILMLFLFLGEPFPHNCTLAWTLLNFLIAACSSKLSCDGVCPTWCNPLLENAAATSQGRLTPFRHVSTSLIWWDWIPWVAGTHDGGGGDLLLQQRCFTCCRIKKIKNCDRKTLAK